MSDQSNALNFWNEQWLQGATGWDIGYASPAIARFMSKVENKSDSILIPGCGNAHEAQYLVEQGFTNITLLDIAPAAVERLRLKFEAYPGVKILQEDFFKHQASYDWIIEQTFFCAIPPAMRASYVVQMHQLLKPGGHLVGLLFNTTFDKAGPPYGGSIQEYEQLFQPYFQCVKMETCYNSIPPRAGNELFIHLIKSIS